MHQQGLGLNFTVSAVVLSFVWQLELANGAPAATAFRIKLPNTKSYNLASPAGLQNLAGDLEQLIWDQESYLANRKKEQRRLREATPLAQMSFAELQAYYAEPLERPTSNELRSLRELQSQLRLLKQTSDPVGRTNIMRLTMEIARSVENLRRPPIPTRVEVASMPFMLLDYLRRPVGKGKSPAANIHAQGGEADLSRIDPPDSSFWKKPANIGQADLFHSLGRDDWPDYENIVWEYAKPKTSFGSNPGFKVRHEKLELKVKFGELHSEPFATRVFHALGYNVEQTDYVRSLRIKYDRRLFREFHLRKELELKMRLLGILPSGHVRIQKRYGPFDFIIGAVLKNEVRLTGEEFKQRLLCDSQLHKPEDDPDNFDPAFEEQVDCVITSAANVQLRDASVANLGPWEFGGLEHEGLRELRGVALLAAWLGWLDARFNNTRIKLVAVDDGNEMRHYFSDLGAGLGKSVGFFSWSSDNPNAFDWTFTRPARLQGKGRMTIPFRIVNYRPIDQVPAFKAMTVDDARWMARMIGRFTEEQMVQALVASGFNSVEVRLLTEKLTSRRDRMIVDLELADEILPLRPQGVSRKFSYEPAREGVVEIKLADGQLVRAPACEQIIEDGRIVSMDKSHSDRLDNLHAEMR